LLEKHVTVHGLQESPFAERKATLCEKCRVFRWQFVNGYKNTIIVGIRDWGLGIRDWNYAFHSGSNP